jgi:hypothetical protein
MNGVRVMAVEEDRFEAIDDESLLGYLTEGADQRRETLVIEQRGEEWIAETFESGGLSGGRSLMLGAAGPDRRTAMLGLARKFEAARW